MARVVSVIGITHNPFMPRLFNQEQRPPGTEKVIERIDMMREKLRQARPDTLVAIGNDHLNQFFMDNMPPFLLGKMETFEGTFYNEVREFGLPVCRVPGDVTLAGQILDGMLERGIDMSYSNELRLDHSIIVPLLWVRPELDLPVVPMLTNCIAPPLPRPRRFYQVGQALRATIDAIPSNKRVAVVISGHLSLEVGGPKQFERRLLDPTFDERAVGWIKHRDIEGAVQGCSFDVLRRSGNMTHGFLNFLTGMGIAHDTPPAYAEGLDAGFPAVPFFHWDLSKEVAA